MFFSVFQKARYVGWGKGAGKSILERNETLESLEAYAMKQGEPGTFSVRQEYLENLLGSYH